MKLFVICFLVMGLSSLAFAASPELWALNVGENWFKTDASNVIVLDPFTFTDAIYPVGGLLNLWDAAYLASTSTLFISGGLDTPYWYSSAIAIYHGGPNGLELVSFSDAGMNDVNWLAGIEYIDGNLYGIAETNFSNGNTFFVQIDNPGTPSQTVTQIGPYLGTTEQLGHPYALCKDGKGGLIGSFSSSFSSIQSLYRIDITTGTAHLLHEYPRSYFEGAIEGLTIAQNRLFAVDTWGKMFEINTSTYEAIMIGGLSRKMWTALVTVPEPSMVLVLIGSLLFLRRKCK